LAADFNRLAVLGAPDLVTIVKSRWPKSQRPFFGQGPAQTQQSSIIGKTVEGIARNIKTYFVLFYKNRPAKTFSGKKKGVVFSPPRRITWLTDWTPGAIRYAVFSGSLLLMTWFVSGIELLLAKNSITEVYTMTSTTQLIPFNIGIGTVAKLCFNALTHRNEVPLLIRGFLVRS